MVQLSNPAIEARWIGKKVKELLDGSVQPSDIDRARPTQACGARTLNALKAAEVPAKSYYDESQLETDHAQMRFAFFNRFLAQQR